MGQTGGGGAETLNGWKGLEDLLRGFEGESFDEWQMKGKQDLVGQRAGKLRKLSFLKDLNRS